jgi:CDP-diacylglycerol--glycerol-3-phosphate 3-phosphatidyltransferase
VTLYALKPRFQALLRPLVGRLAAAGATANRLTLAAAIGSIATGAFIALLAPARWPFLLLPLWLFLRMVLNAVDGMLAREHGQKSRLGAYLNEISDVVTDAALYAPVALVPPIGPYWMGLIVFLATLAEFAGALGPLIGASRRYEGPMGKSDRALVFGAFALWVGLDGPLPDWTLALVVILAALLAVTIANRVRAGLAEQAAKA